MKTADAVTYFGSGAALAAAVGISRAAVSQWGELVPLATAARLEKLTDGRLTLDIDTYAMPIPRVPREKAA
jgi:DNA-binding transcriptional regulator YdaS (Cro superfamily)